MTGGGAAVRLGIDFGTTRTVVACSDRGNYPVLSFTDEEGNPLDWYPSVVAEREGELRFGFDALAVAAEPGWTVVRSFKRLLAAARTSPEQAVEVGGTRLPLLELLTRFLTSLREAILTRSNRPKPLAGSGTLSAVVATPANAHGAQRFVTLDAFRRAGFEVLALLNEPSAAGFEYTHRHRSTLTSRREHIVVYDLGGGTFDASVLELSDTLYEVVSTGGDTFLGGIDFDNAITTWLLEEFRLKTGQVFQGDRVALQRIQEAAERAKCALSERSEVRVHVPFATMIDSKPYDVDVHLTREKLIALTKGLVDRTLQVCTEVLQAKGLGPQDIQEVILVGGQSRFPLVHEKITAFFGRPPTKNVHPDEAVAIGAALLAHSMGQVEGVVLIDVLPMAIGIGLPGGRFMPVLARNASLPATTGYELATTRDNQTELELAIFQGDSDKALENEYLGTLRLTGLPRAPRGGVRVAVTFAVDGECILKVTARELSRGTEVSSTFSSRRSPALAQEAGEG